MAALLLVLPLLALHAVVVASLHGLSRALGLAPDRLAALPLVNLLVPVRLAGLRDRFAFLLLVPGVNLVLWLALWDEIALRLRRPRWMAFAMLAPPLNLVVLAALGRLRRAQVAAAALVAVLLVPAAWASHERRVRDRLEGARLGLQDTQPEARVRAARSLRVWGAEAAPAAPWVAHATRDSDPGVRLAALGALETIGAGAAAELSVLERPLAGGDTTEVRAASRAAIAVSPGIGATTLDEVAILLAAARHAEPHLLPKVVLVDALARGGAPAVGALILGLRDGSASVRWHAAAALLQIGRPAAGALAALLLTMREDPEWDVRNAAGAALEFVAERNAVPVLAEALGDPNVEVRYHAARALVVLKPGNTAAIPALALATRDLDSDVRRYATRALGHPGAAAAVADLIRALDDPAPDVRSSAAFALWEIGEPGRVALPEIRRHLRDPERGVRANAEWLLARFEAR